MYNTAILSVILLFAVQSCRAQDNTTTAAPPVINVTQNVTLSPNQTMNFNLGFPGGGRLLGALGWITSIFKNKDDSFLGRCLGAARKLKFIMPFLLFKLGVIVTTLGFLTLFALKGLGIGVLLLILNAGGLIGKAALLKAGYFMGGHGHGGYSGYGGGYGGGYKEWYPTAPQATPAVHLHVHKDSDGHYNIANTGSSSGHHEYPPTAWSDRISKGLSESKTMAEKYELINLYKRLGFDVNAVLRKQPPNGVNYVFPRKVNR